MKTKYIVTSGDDRQEVDSIGRAKLLAGEWQLEADKLVIIERPAQVITLNRRKVSLRRRRWKATLTPSMAVRLAELHCEAEPDLTPREWWKRNLLATQARADKEAKKKKGPSRSYAKVGKPKKPVICIETNRRYSSLSEAADSLVIDHNAMRRAIKRGGTCGGFHWRYIHSLNKGAA